MGIIGTPLGYIMYAIQFVVKNYGVALILFVLLTKVAFYPLSIKQQKSMAKTAAFQPKLKALEKKCGKDKQKYQAEMMKLYEQEGINPAGGCLPMIIQMVFLFGIIDVIYNPLKHLLRMPADLITKAKTVAEQIAGKMTSGAELSVISQVQMTEHVAKYEAVLGTEWIEKISNFDMSFLGLNMGEIPVLGWNWLMIIPILSGVTAFLSSFISTKIQEKNGQPMQNTMKYLMYGMPLMSVWIAFSLPAGVGIYWIVSNIAAVAQSIILAKIYTPEKMAAEHEKYKEKNSGKIQKKREKREAYNKLLEERGMRPKAIAASVSDAGEVIEGENLSDDEKIEAEKKANAIRESMMSQKELSKKRIADARKKMAEKYGDEYSE